MLKGSTAAGGTDASQDSGSGTEEGEAALRDRHEQLLARLRLREEAERSCWRQIALLLYMVDEGHLRAHGYPYLAELDWEVQAGVPQCGVACSVFVDEEKAFRSRHCMR